MKLGEIDINKKPLNPNLFLCRPDKKTIKKLSEAYDINYLTQLGTVNEISFKIPSVIEKDRVAITNPNIENIRHRYLFKLTLGHSTEYFIFNERNKMFSNEEYIEYKAYSLGYELMDKNIRELELETKNLSEMISEILTYTNWKLGYVDSEFDLKYRSHEISSQTVLQSVYDLAEKFNAVIIWNTIKREVNFYNPSNVGINKGLRMKYGKYLESFNLATDSTDTVTRLKLFGQDGLSIRRLSPTGVNYIEDFSWYMYPFEMDETGNVINESFYMSNSLCISLLEYGDLLEEKSGEFESLTDSITEKQDGIQKEEQKLSVLNIELIIIKDQIDVSNASYNSDTPQHAQLIADKENKEAEIQSQEALISTLKNEKSDLEDSVLNLQELLIMENNFTGEQLIELNQFIIEKEYINDSIIDDDDLLEEGIENFKKLREPRIDLSIDVINFLEVIECQNDWDKLVLGDIIRVQHERFGEDIQAKIIEINYSFEDRSITLNIANESEMNQIDDFMQKIYEAGNTSTIVNMDKYKWDLSLENNGAINEIINNKWDALKNAILAGYDQQIEISERGIIVKSLDDPDTFLVIQNGHLAITNDSGNTWKHSITSEGIVGERIYGKIIMGVNLAIEDESGILKFRGSRGQIFDRNGDEQMRLGLVTDSPDEECFGILLDNRKHRVHMTSCDGFMIEKWESNSWAKKMYADLDGNFWVENFTAKEITIIDDDGYFRFEGNKGVISDGNNPIMWLGYIPAGSVTTCSPPSDFGTILKGTNNSLIYMTKSRGFAIDVNCENKFRVDTDGSLYAQDIVAHNLKIVDGELGEKIILDHEDGITINGNDGEQIRLNANEGIAIDVQDDKRIWIGKDGMMYAKRLIVVGDEDDDIIEDVDGSYISDLTVNKLKTLNSNSPQDYVHIEDNFIKLNTEGYGGAGNEGVTKFALSFEGVGASAFPKMIWGAGGAGGLNQGYQYKDGVGFHSELMSADGGLRKISMQNRDADSVLIDTPKGVTINAGSIFKVNVGSSVLEITPNGIKLNGSRIDLN